MKKKQSSEKKVSERVIKSFEEFKNVYFPISTEQERIKKMTPAELGKKLAQDSIDKLKPFLKK